MIILIADKHQAFGSAMIIKLMDPLSANLIKGYDLVITITISFLGPNNLQNLVNIILEKKSWPVNHNPSTNFTKLDQRRLDSIQSWHLNQSYWSTYATWVSTNQCAIELKADLAHWLDKWDRWEGYAINSL